jgi:hypothetical protein
LKQEQTFAMSFMPSFRRTLGECNPS